MKKVGVFGGTFDPVHNGHLAIALAALETIPLDRVIFVPARRSPLKEVGPVAGETDRVAMLERAVEGEPRFAVSRVEIEREDPSYTVETLEALSGEGRLFLILGADAHADLARWREPERIRSLATIVVAKRPGTPQPIVTEDTRVLDAPLVDLSARELRADAAAGRSLRYRVPDGVLRYIEERGLYKGDASRTA